MMGYIEDKYFRLNRILFLTIGAWPSQTSVFALFDRIICHGILLSFNIAQLLTLTKSTCNMILLTKVLSMASLSICVEVEYHTFLMKRDIVKNVLIQFDRMYDEFTDENEIAICQKYGDIAVRYTILFIVILLCSGILFGFAQYWSIFLDVVLPQNESRPHYLLVETEYFIDQEEHFFIILLHMSLAMSITGVVATSVGTAFIGFFQAVCGIFRIANYRIKHVMRSDVLRNIKKNENLIYEGLICAVHIHRKATELSEFIISSFEITILFFFTVIGFITSLNMFRIMLQGDNIEDIIIPVMLIALIFAYFFVISHVGQQIIYNNNDIFVAAYNVQWYKTPIRIQRLILFLLQRNSKTFGLNIRGLLVLSLENFATLFSTTISYFTVLYSTSME